jgi:hypothetical protein
MTKLKTLSAVVILSAAVATPVFAQPTHHSRIHVRHFRGAYNQMIEPYSIPRTHGGRNLENFEFNRSFTGGEDPSNNPPS